MKCVNCGSVMEEYKSYMEGDELIMKYRCSCGYEDSKVINGKRQRMSFKSQKYILGSKLLAANPLETETPDF